MKSFSYSLFGYSRSQSKRASSKAGIGKISVNLFLFYMSVYYNGPTISVSIFITLSMENKIRVEIRSEPDFIMSLAFLLPLS